MLDNRTTTEHSLCLSSGSNKTTERKQAAEEDKAAIEAKREADRERRRKQHQKSSGTGASEAGEDSEGGSTRSYNRSW